MDTLIRPPGRLITLKHTAAVSERALSDEADVGAPAHFVQPIDSSACLTSCDFKYDR